MSNETQIRRTLIAVMLVAAVGVGYVIGRGGVHAIEASPAVSAASTSAAASTAASTEAPAAVPAAPTTASAEFFLCPLNVRLTF
jgi:hypothetical protein